MGREVWNTNSFPAQSAAWGTSTGSPRRQARHPHLRNLVERRVLPSGPPVQPGRRVQTPSPSPWFLQTSPVSGPANWREREHESVHVCPGHGAAATPADPPLYNQPALFDVNQEAVQERDEHVRHVGDHQHLRLRQAGLHVVEVQHLVVGDEAHPDRRVRLGVLPEPTKEDTVSLRFCRFSRRPPAFGYLGRWSRRVLSSWHTMPTIPLFTAL